MATNITSATSTDFSTQSMRECTAFVKVTGAWGGTSMAIQTRNGNDEWETYPSNGTQTANFAYYFTIGDEAGIRLVTTGGSSIDLWAQVSAGIDQ
jgi:hypothetical protein